jgi:peptidoglycan/LPS O-acetylase OafA/YrhL
MREHVLLWRDPSTIAETPQHMSTERPSSDRFVLLDGLRGIAAIFIIQRHAEDLLGDALPSSYLGVDLFFALSGFVLAHAYGSALADGSISPLQFMKARLLRLYPLYAVALALGTAYYVHMYFAGLPVMADERVVPEELVLAFLTGLLFLPSPITISFNAALFLVHPAWSLFNELVANAAYALRGARAKLRQIGVVLAVSAVLLVVAAIQFDRLHAGFRWHEMYAGMARVFFSFFAGVVIYRYRRKIPLVRPFQALACLAILIAVLAFPTPRDLRPVFDLLVVFIVWPALLYWASAVVPDARTAAISAFLGTASYAVYVLHTPLLDWAHAIWPGITQPEIAPFAGTVLVALVVLISWYLTIRFDQPLQRNLKRRVLYRKPALS